MKRILTLLLIILSAIVTGGCEKQYIIPNNEIPEKITEFVAIHFPKNKINHAFKEIDDFAISYEIFLNEGFSLEFDGNFDITEVTGNTKLPDSVIPAEIRNYIAQNFSNNFIVEWELENRYQKVELDNEVELEFSKDGLWVSIDN